GGGVQGGLNLEAEPAIVGAEPLVELIEDAAIVEAEIDEDAILGVPQSRPAPRDVDRARDNVFAIGQQIERVAGLNPGCGRAGQLGVEPGATTAADARQRHGSE